MKNIKLMNSLEVKFNKMKECNAGCNMNWKPTGQAVLAYIICHKLQFNVLIIH